MDFETILTDLRAEVSRLTQAIAVIEGLQQRTVKPRGRPRKWPVGVGSGPKDTPSRPEPTPDPKD